MYRNAVFVVKGLKEYTKGAYSSASKHFISSDVEVDCTGRCFMVTGANSGIGKAIALQLAQKGGTVHIVCRNKERGEKALEEMRQTSGNRNIFLHIVDMSKPASILEFTKQFSSSGHPLHVLVNNAGSMTNVRELNQDGLEINFATNTLGTYILTVELVPLLTQHEDPRVVTVSSAGMLTMKLDVEDLSFEKMSPFDGTFAYAQTKRQQVVMMEQLGRKHPSIHFSSMHPGWADTPGVETAMPSFHNRMKNKLRTSEEGGDTAVWLAVSQAARKHANGQFFQDRKSVPKHLPLAWTRSNPQDEQRFMDTLKEIYEKFVPSQEQSKI